jgi:uncharacterized protein
MMVRPLILCLALAGPALADFPEAVTGHILPGYARFADAAADLAAQADASCDSEALKPAFHATFDAWMGVQHIHLGPVEDEGRGLAIAFWPDPKALGLKAQLALLTGDPAALAPDAFAEQSIAARGLMGLERLLYPQDPLPADACPLLRATARDLARLAGDVQAGWADGFAQSLITAGEAGNTRFLSRTEARQAMFTQIASGLEQLKDQRLGRPMGEPSRPRPERAEARASGRSLRNVVLALQAMRQLVETLTPDVPQTLAAFDRAISLAEALNDPVLAGTATPEGRLKVEILQQAIAHTIEVALGELAPELDVGIGFNAQDGD